MKLLFKHGKRGRADREYTPNESSPKDFWFEGNHLDYARIADAIIWLHQHKRQPLDAVELIFVRAIVAKLIKRHRLDLEEVTTLERYYTKRGCHRFDWTPPRGRKRNYVRLTARDFDPLQMFLKRFQHAGIDVEEFAGCEIVYGHTIQEKVKPTLEAKVADLEAQNAMLLAQMAELKAMIQAQAKPQPRIVLEPATPVPTPAHGPADRVTLLKDRMRRHGYMNGESTYENH